MVKCSFIDQNGICQLMREPAPEDCKCPHYTAAPLNQCVFCKQITLDGVFILNKEDKPFPICKNCSTAFGTCRACQESAECRFQSDPSPIPPVIMETRQQGNMVIQQQVINPERVKITCALCECWSGEECWRQTAGTCGKYKEIEI